MDQEPRYFCLECLGYDFYMSTVTLGDGFEAWLHMCKKCNIRMEYCGSDLMNVWKQAEFAPNAQSRGIREFVLAGSGFDSVKPAQYALISTGKSRFHLLIRFC